MIEMILRGARKRDCEEPKPDVLGDITVPDVAPKTALKKDRSLLLLGLAIAAQAGCLFAFVAPYQNALSFGPTVILKGTSYDPRDILKGDYVSINYDIGKKVSLASYPNGSTVYLTMQKALPTWEAVTASKEMPTALKADQVAIKAIVTDGKMMPPQISLGIEKYYIPEGTGNGVNGELSAEVAVGKDGLPVFKRLMVSGVPFKP